jgi:hypothetical protein
VCVQHVLTGHLSDLSILSIMGLITHGSTFFMYVLPQVRGVE